MICDLYGSQEYMVSMNISACWEGSGPCDLVETIILNRLVVFSTVT